MKIIELTKVMDWQNARSDKKVMMVMDNVMYFEEIPNGNGCIAIRYLNGTEIHVRETYAHLKVVFGI